MKKIDIFKGEIKKHLCITDYEVIAFLTTGILFIPSDRTTIGHETIKFIMDFASTFDMCVIIGYEDDRLMIDMQDKK